MMSRTPKQCVEEILEKGMENFVPPIKRYEEPDPIDRYADWESEYVRLMIHHTEESDMWMAVIREMASQLKASKEKHQAATKHIKDVKAESARVLKQAEEDEMSIREAHMKTGNELAVVKEELERVSMLYAGETKMSSALARQIIDTRKERDTALLDRDSARRERDHFIQTATKETKEYLELLGLAHAAQERLEKELNELKNAPSTVGQADIPPQ